ncbi:MAG: disulfide bond formation protein B [Rubrivivax sp.]|nr:disulfide bond formation protein B [Rubrivivax sp.]
MAAMALLSLAAVGSVVYIQHALDVLPCPWCVLQRLIMLAIAAACALGLLLPRLGAALALPLAGCGVAAALWQHFVAASAQSCDLSLADRLIAATGLDARFPDVFMAMASCADAKPLLLGLPYELWSLALFALLAVTSAWILLRRRR